MKSGHPMGRSVGRAAPIECVRTWSQIEGPSLTAIGDGPLGWYICQDIPPALYRIASIVIRSTLVRGMVWQARCGKSVHGLARQGRAGRGMAGKSRIGEVRLG